MFLEPGVGPKKAPQRSPDAENARHFDQDIV